MSLHRVLIPIGILALIGCEGSDAKFVGSANRLAKSSYTTKAEGDAVVVTPAPVVAAVPTVRPEFVYSEEASLYVSGSKYSGVFEAIEAVNTSLSAGVVWAVTGFNGGIPPKDVSAVYRVELDESRGFPIWRKEIPFEWGNRSYVSEIGFLIGRTQRTLRNIGGIYVAGPEYPNGIQPIFTKADLSAAEQPTLWMRNEARMCVTSFQIDGVPYVGGGYNSLAGRKMFVKIPIDKSKANGVDISKKQIFDLGAVAVVGGFGYSCYTDQNRGWFWSEFGEVGSVRSGVNLRTGVPLNASEIPNKSHSFSNVDLVSSPTNRASYAMAGDASGNIASFTVAGASAYTAAHESVSNFVYVSRGSNLHLLHANCLSSQSDCSTDNGRYFKWNLSGMSDGAGGVFNLAFGPLSSLNDGRVVGVRFIGSDASATSEIYLVKPKDPSDLSKGPSLKKIANLSERAYMYTDFTGATLYAAKVSREIELSKVSAFKAGVAISDAKFLWRASSGAAEEWRGLKLQLRCFLKSVATKPAFVDFVPANGNVEKLLPCSGIFDTVEYSVEGTGANNFSRTAQFVIRAKQQQE